jgi:hypothetical protein
MRPESSARFVVRRPREERMSTFTIADETHNFRIPDTAVIPVNDS